MDILPTVAGEPPAPRPIRFADRWRVSWHGRRDARRLPLGSDLTPPYLDSLRAEAEAGQRAVSRWLHEQIVPVDREVVSVLMVLDQHRRDPVPPPQPRTVTRPAPAPDDPPREPTFSIPGWVLEAREIAAEHKKYRRQIAECNAAEQQLSKLGATRYHLIETGRTVAGAHTARYEQLLGYYYAALLRRRPDRDLTEIGYQPRAVATDSWVHGDMPLLTLEAASDLPERYRWFLKEFATRTSALRGPIGIEIPRAS